jgi:hypothetical protein
MLQFFISCDCVNSTAKGKKIPVPIAVGNLTQL